MTAASLNKTSQYLKDLLEGLNKLPYTWALTPVKGDKRPYRKNWQNEKPIEKQLIELDIQNGIAKGYGLRTGIVSGGIVAVDADGHAAHEKILELSGGIPLPETVSFTSNKPGRCQYLFYIPQEYWTAITTKKIGTGFKGDDGKEQKLELRWNGCQSVLPPSVHPETGFYRWRKSVSEIVIAPAPMWLIEAMLISSGETDAPLLNPQPKTQNYCIDNKWTDIDWALSYLSALSTSRADDYDEWLKVGVTLHSVADSLLIDWDNWSRHSSKYKPGECAKKWESFNISGSTNGKATIATLAHMAKQDGWESQFKTIEEGEISKEKYYRLQAEKTNATISQRTPVEKDKLFKNNSLEKITKEIKKAFCQQVYENLFQDNNYIYVHNQFHKWTGTHYEPMAIAVITKKIHDYCDSYEVVKEKIITYPYAAPNFVTMALNWLKQKFGIDPKKVNPSGLNCIDGILQLSFDPDSKTLIKTLVPHDPSFYYLYAPQATYHISPITLPDPCNRLLSCLDAPQRDIFLKTIGAAFDLPTVRRYKGRGIKALLLHGTGSNGKDTLRHVTSMMFGKRGMVSVAFGDFIQYDQGRKFPAQKLDGALVNWPSENGDDVTLDKIQSLKIAITGDSLSGEKKGKDEYEFNPKCVNLFNYNLPPKLQGSMQAILDRFAILKFNKTYKTKPAPGELQADPRFLYDDDFIRTEVLPWYLYYCLDALERLMREGVNYDVTEQAWEDLRAESDHIYAFCQEVGIGYKRGGQLTTEEVNQALREWYIENGTLQLMTFGEVTKDVWSPNPAWGDSLIKGKNQIFARLLKIFPEARRDRDSSGRAILLGVGWNLPTPPDGKNVSICYSSEDALKQSEDDLKMLKPLQNQHSEDAEAVLTSSENFLNLKIEESCGCGAKCPACFSESAKNLANAMLRCESGKEVQELLAQYAHLNEAAWRALTEEGHDHVRDLLFKWEIQIEEPELEPEDYKEGSPPQNHLQHLHNADSIKVSPSSGHLQTASEHLQNCSSDIQNEPIDFSDFIARTNNQMSRLGWTKEEGTEYLWKTYGKRSRKLLTDGEFQDFHAFLEAQPTPEPENSVDNVEAQPTQLDLVATEPVRTQPITQQPSKVSKRVRIEKPENFIIECGEGVVVDDRGDGSIEVMMQTGKRAGIQQVVTKGYVFLDE